MEPVGITYACTRVVVRNSSSRRVMVHSAMVLRGRSRCGSSGCTMAGTPSGSRMGPTCSGISESAPEVKGRAGSVGSWGVTTSILADRKTRRQNDPEKSLKPEHFGVFESILYLPEGRL